MCLAIVVVVWGDVRQRFDLLIVNPSVAWQFVDCTLQLSCCPGNGQRGLSGLGNYHWYFVYNCTTES